MGKIPLQVKTAAPVLAIIWLLCLVFVSAQTGKTSQYMLAKDGAHLLDPTQASKLFDQCSRSAPIPEKGLFWKPDKIQIKELETRLYIFLEKFRNAEERHPPTDEIYLSQYVGFYEKGKRLIYGNFYPEDEHTRGDRSLYAVIFCDGGEPFWGIVYDPDSGEFSRLSMNGP